MNAFDKLSHLLARLQGARIYHQLRDTRENAVSVDVAVPGERWEIDFLDDGSIEVEVFRSDGAIHSAAKLDELVSTFSDPVSGTAHP